MLGWEVNSIMTTLIAGTSGSASCSEIKIKSLPGIYGMTEEGAKLKNAALSAPLVHSINR